MSLSQVREPQPVSIHGITYGHDNFCPEIRTPVTEGVKPALLAARIDPRRQFRQERLIVLPTYKPFVQLLGVYTVQDRPQASIQHLTSQVGGVLCRCPYWEQRLDASTLQESDPVFPDVVKEHVTKSNVSDAS